MPYNNQYNSNVAQVVRGYSQKHINRENAVNDFSTSYEIPSMVEASVLKNPEVHGGSVYQQNQSRSVPERRKEMECRAVLC